MGSKYWKCSSACRSVLEMLLVSQACRSRPMVLDSDELVSLSMANLYLGTCPEYHAFSLHVQKTTPSFILVSTLNSSTVLTTAII